MEYDLLFNVVTVNVLLKSNRGRDRSPHFVIVVVWSALVFGRWLVAARGRKYYLGPAETLSIVYPV